MGPHGGQIGRPVGAVTKTRFRVVRSCGHVAMSSERRVINEKTGGAKGQKDSQLGAIDPISLLELGKVAGYGATKYERYNFLKGYSWSLSFDALCRHIFAFWGGEDNDPESGLPHMAHAAFHCLALTAYARFNTELDDRPK